MTLGSSGRIQLSHTIDMFMWKEREREKKKETITLEWQMKWLLEAIHERPDKITLELDSLKNIQYIYINWYDNSGAPELSTSGKWGRY